MWLFSFGKRNTAKLLATGQVTSYGSGTGVDDGALKKGIVKRYTVLTTGQYSGTTAIVLNGKTDTHSNNCVFDDNTGLMWSRYMAASVGPASDGKIPWTTNGSGEGVFTYCAAANAGTMAGYTDWRVPNVFEGCGILDNEAPTSAPDSVAFPSWSTGDYFWSSTTRPSSTTAALAILFLWGQISSLAKTTNAYCFLVR